MQDGRFFPRAMIGAGLAVIFTGVLAAADKLSLEEVIEKHRASIGSSQVLEDRTATAASAVARVEIQVGGSGQMEGATLFGSQNGSLMVLMDFNEANYQVEHLIYNGRNVEVAFMRPGSRSPLGEFLFTYKYLMSDGLFGGSLASTWVLLDPGLKDAKVRYRGVKKFNGQKVHRLDYVSKKGKDVEVQIFLDETTFRHVGTKYEVIINPIIGASPGLSSQQRPVRTMITESFGDFQELDGITSPRSWGVHYQRTGNNASTGWRWTVKFNKVGYNQPLNESFFKLGARFN